MRCRDCQFRGDACPAVNGHSGDSLELPCAPGLRFAESVDEVKELNKKLDDYACCIARMGREDDETKERVAELEKELEAARKECLEAQAGRAKAQFRVAELEGIERAAKAHLERRKKNAEALGFECSASHKLRVKELESILSGLGPDGKKV